MRHLAIHRPKYTLVGAAAALVAMIVCGSTRLAWADGAAAAAKIDFARDVGPIFVEHCYECHGPDAQESGLRFDRRDAALAGGDSGPLFTPGKSGESELIRRVTATDEERMPPAEDNNKPLSADQIARLKAWIDAGAVWPEASAGRSSHWSFQPIARPEPPAVRNTAWPRSPLDRFVLARLEAQGIAPSPEADRYTLIKRLTYDLLGLPPETDEVDAFVNDTSPDAYEKLVDRLLDSPHFGERWGRHWLDMARYADSDGYEKDNSRPDAWRYRDWVIRAVNNDLPLDRFTIEQLAGDLLPGATADDRLATAFHRQTLTNTEGGTDREQWRVEAIFDRVATTGSVWLGLTVGCAQCHTHKYDPISHHEFYQLFAFFDNGDEVETEVPLVGEPLLTWRREKEQAAAELAKLEPKLAEARQALAAKAPAWEEELKSKASKPLEFHPVELVNIASKRGAEFKILSDGSYLAAGENPDKDVVTITARTDLPEVTGFRIETLAHQSLGGKGPGRTAHGNFVLGEFRVSASDSDKFGKKQRVKLAHANADVQQDGFPPENALDGKENTGWAIGPKFGQDHSIVFLAEKPIRGEATPNLQLVLSQNYGGQHTLGRFRVMAVTGYDAWIGIPQNVRDILAIETDKRTPEQTQALVDHVISRDKPATQLADKVEKLRGVANSRPVMKARVLAERTENRRTTHVLHRGDFLQPKDEVRPGTLAALPPIEPRAPRPTGSTWRGG